MAVDPALPYTQRAYENHPAPAPAATQSQLEALATTQPFDNSLIES